MFFESSQQPIDLDMPTSPSRASHESVNSSNSASDTESVSSNIQTSLSSTPGTSSYQPTPKDKHRISSSLPGSAGPTMVINNNYNNHSKFKWSQKEINYTELAPDSPGYHSR